MNSSIYYIFWNNEKRACEFCPVKSCSDNEAERLFPAAAAYQCKPMDDGELCFVLSTPFNKQRMKEETTRRICRKWKRQHVATAVCLLSKRIAVIEEYR